MAKVLLIEDNREFADVVDDWLTADLHVVERVETGKEGSERLQHYQYDVIVLDWNLPDISGIDVLRQYRQAKGKTPVLMLTGESEIAQKEKGLDSGADDYLTKPFEPRELSARIRALLRRSGEMRDTVLQVGDLVLHPDKKKVEKAGQDIQLAPMEYALLEFLMRHPDQVFSQETLLERVWSNDSETTADSLRVHVARLRSKIDREGAESMIRTVHRQGYKLVPPGKDS